MRYRKKPVVVEAFRFGSDSIPDWFMDRVSSNDVILYNCGSQYTSDPYCCIKTLEGVIRCDCGDYVIQGVNGELYPCKSDIFEKTYEEEGSKKNNIELLDVAKPLIHYLEGHYDPHCKIEISTDTVKVIRTERQDVIVSQS